MIWEKMREKNTVEVVIDILEKDNQQKLSVNDIDKSHLPGKSKPEVD